MKRTLLCLTICSMSFYGMSQDVLFTEDFETGGSFDLNTADEGGLSAGSSPNQWIVNSWYNEGWGTDTPCSFSDMYIATTPAQPAGISSANGNYLHVHSDLANGLWTGGPMNTQNANYTTGALAGGCSGAHSVFASMGSDISTAGYSDVNLSFWWLCEGNFYGYGEVYYSLDGGSSWTKVTTTPKYYSQMTWVEETLTDVAWNDEATIRFGFRMVMEDDIGGYEMLMSMGIDDVEITATPGVSCTDTYHSFTVDACDSYTVPSGDETITTSGTVNDTIMNAEGCDSIMTITVNITTVDVSVTTAPGELTANATGGGITYQWIDCADSSTIAGATSATFMPAGSGDYAVIVTDGSCSDTSDCNNVIVGSIRENDFGHNIEMYPNPSSDVITIILGESYQSVDIEIVDMTGRVIFKSEYQNVDQISGIEVPDAAGMYVMHITSEGKHAALNLIVE